MMMRSSVIMMFWQASLYFEVLLPTYRGQRNRDPLKTQTLQIVQKSLKHMFYSGLVLVYYRECVRNLDLRVQVHPGELWVSKKRVHIVLEASKSAGAKGDVPKTCGFVHLLHPL